MARRRRKGKRRKKNINIHPFEVGLVLNGVLAFGLPQAMGHVANGNFKAATQTLADRANMQNAIRVGVPAVGWAFVKPMVAGKIPKIQLGNVIVHAL